MVKVNSLRFEESLIKVCIDTLEDSAKRINELRQMHIDKNYEGDIKPFVANEIREKIDEYYRVWNVLKNYFDDDTKSHAPSLDEINSILWLKEFDEKYEPQESISLITDSMDFNNEPDDTRRSRDEDITRSDLFKALEDIDLIDELNFGESSIISLKNDVTTSSKRYESTLIESDPIKSFQEFYLKILNKKEFIENSSPLEEPLFPPAQLTDSMKGTMEKSNVNTYAKDSSNEAINKINMMKQYRDYVYKLRPNFYIRDRANHKEHPDASDKMSAVDTAVIPSNKIKELNHKLKYYKIGQNTDYSDKTNQTPELAVYHINNNVTEKKKELGEENIKLNTILRKENIEISNYNETRMIPVVGEVVSDASIIFGIILLSIGAYLISTNILSLSDIKSTETTIQILFSIIDQLPGVPISINYLRNFNILVIGVVVLAIGMITVLMGVDLMRNINTARSIGALLYILSTIFDIIDMLYFGSVNSPINIIAFIINLLFCGIFLKDVFWVHHKL